MADIYRLQVLLFALAGFVNRRQQAVIEYLPFGGSDIASHRALSPRS